MRTRELKSLSEAVRRVVMREFTTDSNGKPIWDPGKTVKGIVEKYGFQKSVTPPHFGDDYDFYHKNDVKGNRQIIHNKKDDTWEHFDDSLIDRKGDPYHIRKEGRGADSLDEHMKNLNK